MKLKKSLLAGLILVSTMSGCAGVPTETLYHKIHVTLNMSWKTDPSQLSSTDGTKRFMAQGSGVVEMDFIFPDNGESIKHIVAQDGYVYITDYSYEGDPCTVTIPAERMSPNNYSEWAVAQDVFLGDVTDGSESYYGLGFGGFDYLNSPIDVTYSCGDFMQPYTYPDSTIDYVLFGNLGSSSPTAKSYNIDIKPIEGTVYTQTYEDTFEFYTHTTDITATYLGLYTKDELVGEFDEMRDL